MLIEKVDKMKMETHHLIHIVGLLQFMVNENNEDNIDEILNKSVNHIEEQLKLLKVLNNELKQMSEGE
ncbi:hypothetical protein MHB40_14765 [Lysinibacillus sp. FSL K6-0057]|uniref:hypothetical protein n=1 Tax=Lysinibacillus sp. FSL K6-0057 TaxID=2921411 RepID=UPI00315A7DC8